MLNLAAPILLLLSIACVHAGYFLLVRHVLTQQPVQVAAFPSTRLAVTGAEASGGFRSRRAGRGGGADGPVRRARPMNVKDGVFRQPLICGRGLTISGEAVFLEPVKVSGDLIISGQAIFNRPVVVNGDVRVMGDAFFHQGLLTKSDLIVAGHVIIGSDGKPGWLVARQARVRGGLWLNGELETTHQAYPGRGAA